MKHPLLTLFRHCALRSLKGGAATGLLPLGQFRSALVIIESTDFSTTRSIYVHVFLCPILWIRERL